MVNFGSILSLERMQRLRALVVPGSAPLDHALLKALAGTVRQTLFGPVLVFASLMYLAYDKPRATWLLSIALSYIVLSWLNHRRIFKAAAWSAAAPADSLEKAPDLVRVIFVKNIATFLALAMLMGAVPWVMGSGFSAYGELTTTLILIGYTLLLAFMHSAFPCTVLVFATVVCLAVTGYWLSTPYEFKLPLAALTLVFYALLLRSTFRFGRILRMSLLLQVERDEARITAENAALKLEQALKSLRQANAEKLRLFAAANHDLRQPISAISLFVGVLQRKLSRSPEGLAPEINDLFDKVDRNIQTLDVIVSSLADITSSESGGYQIKPELFELQSYVAALVNEFDRQSEIRQTPITLKMEPRRMYADAGMLARILRNVIDNALKYAYGREVKISVLMRVSSGQSTVLEPWLSVRDHGPGIPAQYRDEVFVEYVQMANPERDRNKGYGLGLSIVKRLADTLGAAIELREPLGGGLEFLLNLSTLLAPSRTIHAGALPNLEKMEHAQPDLARPSLDPAIVAFQETRLSLIDERSKKIMIVDDDDDVRAGLSIMVGLWGYEVQGFANMTHALAHLRALSSERLPRHILLDNWLPDARALDCIQLIKGLSPGSHLSLVTGDTDSATLARASQLGVRVLHKPIKPESLAELIK